MQRHILASDPRVTRFPIDWGDSQAVAMATQMEVDAPTGIPAVNGNCETASKSVEDVVAAAAACSPMKDTPIVAGATNGNGHV